MNTDGLAAEARRAALRSYSPYSRFRVGAVVVDSEGRRHTGANVENAAYGSSICAEATAISGAVARGVRRIEGVAVACVDADGVDNAYPCGNCRQLMNEFGVEWVVVAAGEGSEVRRHHLSDLHPYGFSLEA
ncbi:MAG: cytidine deaminase [Acidimicrobiia bacterium]|nr:cytidine deaminase [Acidimicrobiia bacterium]